MNVENLRAALKDISGSESIALVDEQGIVYSIGAIRHEPASEDGEGNLTSLGGSVWFQLLER